MLLHKTFTFNIDKYPFIAFKHFDMHEIGWDYLENYNLYPLCVYTQHIVFQYNPNSQNIYCYPVNYNYNELSKETINELNETKTINIVELDTDSWEYSLYEQISKIDKFATKRWVELLNKLESQKEQPNI